MLYVVLWEDRHTDTEVRVFGDLERAINKILSSNRHERRVLLQILGFAGILKPRIVIPIFDRFVPFNERGTETELAYPFSAWRGVDGVDNDAVRFWFPEIADS